MLRAGARQTFAAFSVGRYRLHWTQTVAAFIAFSMSFTVQSVVAFDLTGANAAVGLVGAGNGIAWLIIGPLAGALADRLPKRRLLVLAQSVIALSFLFLAIMIVTGRIAIIWLVASSFLLGASFAFTGPTRRAYIGDLVPQNLVGNGVALLQSALSLPAMIGPAIAAGLLALPFIGPGGAYFAMSALLGLTIASLWLLPPGEPRRARRGGIYREIWLGLRYAAAQPRLRVLLVSLLLISAAGQPYQVLLPGLLENVLGREAEAVGLLQGVAGAGSLAIGLAVAGFVGTPWSGRVMYGMALIFGLGIALLGLAPSAVAAFPFMFMIGAGVSAFQAINTAEVLAQSEPEYHGRLTALTFFPFGVSTLAGLLFGNLADGVGERGVLIAMGLAVIAVAAVSGLRYDRIRELPAEAARAALRPVAALMRGQKAQSQRSNQPVRRS